MFKVLPAVVLALKRALLCKYFSTWQPVCLFIVEGSICSTKINQTKPALFALDSSSLSSAEAHMQDACEKMQLRILHTAANCGGQRGSSISVLNCFS